MQDVIEKKPIMNYRFRALLIATALLFLFSLFYHWVLSFQYSSDSYEEFFSFEDYFRNAGLQFTVFYIFILVVWLIIFVLMKNVSIKIRLLTHIITLPVLVKCSQEVFYEITEQLGNNHLEGAGQIWDIFIPSFFYLVIFTFLHGVEYYFKSQLRLQEKNKFETESLNFELKAIKAQLNPHFLYNVFNTINANIPRENEKTREMIADLSDLLRYQLKASEIDKIVLKDEIESVKTYLRLEKMRFKDRLQVNYSIDEDTLNAIIPPMLIQPLIENSIKHGISKKQSGGQLDLIISKVKDKLQITIKDTGIGIDDIDKALTKGFGLSHTKKRLEKFYQSEMLIEHNKPGGLIIKFEL